MLNKCLNFSSLCCVATLTDTLHHLQVNTKPFGIHFFMNSPQVAIVTPRPVGCHEVAMGDKRLERCPMWANAVSRQLHGASSFPMIRAARHGALVAMEQAVIHMRISYRWLVDRRTGDSGIVEGGNLGKCYYSGTWSWVKPLTIPEIPPIDLYNTCPVDGLSQLYAICGALIMFNTSTARR